MHPSQALNAADLTEIDFMIGPRAFGETYGKRVGHLPLSNGII